MLTFLPYILVLLSWIQTVSTAKKTIRIGFATPFSSRSLVGNAADYINFTNALNTAATNQFNSLLWYFRRVNNDPSILPDIDLELVAINTFLTKGGSLMQTLRLIEEFNVSAVIGDNVQNTITMATAAGANNILHCVQASSIPRLSSKNEFPTSFRTMSTMQFQVKAMLAVAKNFNVSNIGTIIPNNEFGDGFVQAVQRNMGNYNISNTINVFYESELLQAGNNANDSIIVNLWKSVLKEVKAAQIQTVFIQLEIFVLQLLIAMDDMNMLDGSFWFILSTGTEVTDVFIPQKKYAGVWQVNTLNPWDLDSNGATDLARDYKEWWRDLYNMQNKSMAGLPIGYKTDWIFRQSQKDCANDSQLNIIDGVSQLPYKREMNGMKLNLAVQVDQCIGKDRDYLVGGAFAFKIVFGTDSLGAIPNHWMTEALSCGEILVGMFDTYIKSGKLTVDQINNQSAFDYFDNISDMINNAEIPSIYGGIYEFDKSGDMVLNISVQTYFWDENDRLSYKTVGYWTASDEKLNLYNLSEPYIFLGNKTSPPLPPLPREIPTLPYKSNIALRIAMDVIVGLCSAFSISIFIYMLRNIKIKIFVASSPLFLALIIFGANISYASIWFFSRFSMESTSCLAFVWLKYIGFAVVFSALIIKTYRISIIFNSKRRHRQMLLNDGVMMGYFSFFIVCWISILLISSLIPSQRPTIVYKLDVNVAENGTVISFMSTPRCDFGSYSYICLGAMVVTLALGAFLTYTVRKTPNAFNESKWIAYALYNWVVIGIVLNAIINFSLTDPDIIFLLEAITVIIAQTSVILLLFVPKILAIKAGAGDDYTSFDSKADSSRGSQQRKSMGPQPAPNVTTSMPIKIEDCRTCDGLKLKYQRTENHIEETLRNLSDTIEKLEQDIIVLKGTQA